MKISARRDSDHAKARWTRPAARRTSSTAPMPARGRRYGGGLPVVFQRLSVATSLAARGVAFARPGGGPDGDASRISSRKYKKPRNRLHHRGMHSRRARLAMVLPGVPTRPRKAEGAAGRAVRARAGGTRSTSSGRARATPSAASWRPRSRSTSAASSGTSSSASRRRRPRLRSSLCSTRRPTPTRTATDRARRGPATTSSRRRRAAWRTRRAARAATAAPASPPSAATASRPCRRTFPT